MTIKIKGAQAIDPDGSALKTSLVRVKAEFYPDAVRTARHVPEKEKGVAEDDIFEVEFTDGLRLWMRADEYRRLVAPQSARDVQEDVVLDIPANLPLDPPGTATRGALSWAVKSLKVLGFDPRQVVAEMLGETAGEPITEKLAQPVAGYLAKKIDERRSKWRPGTGLYGCRLQTDAFQLTEVTPVAASDQPLLVFIHGLGASTWSSFGDLWSENRQEELTALRLAYGDRALAFEHASFSQGPIQNAIELAKLLPENARLHLITHSRGGLVGELLCRAAVVKTVRKTSGSQEENLREPQPFEPNEFRLFEERSHQRALLDELDQLLRTKKFRVDRFVRVACPALGTTFASRRLDRWLSVIGNLGSLALNSLPLSDLIETLGGFMAAVIKERTDPSTLPGLEAMMPESDFLKIVNWSAVEVPGDLAVIAGDVDPQAWWSKLLVWVTDRFYEGDHDLIVNTASMFGGVRRSGQALVSVHTGPDVNHFTYFQNQDSARRMVQALTAKAEEMTDFEPLVRPTVTIPREADLRALKPMPVVFVLPGIMGSELEVDGNRVWLDISDIIFGKFSKLRVDAANVKPLRPFTRYYGTLIKYLAQNHKVVPFPFDWRLPVEDEAQRLAKAVEREFEDAKRHNQPVRILAHSMGGLVARAMLTRHDGLWQKICEIPGARLVMLGTPNGGSHAITELLVGQSSTLRQLALIDTRNSKKDLLQIICRFPGVLAMLPQDSREDYFSFQTWKDYHDKAGDGWILPLENDLDQAREFRRVMDSAPVDPTHMVYVAGSSAATLCGMYLDPEEKQPGDRIKFKTVARGDGRVTWDSGIPPEVPTWYMENVEHGNLPAHEEAFEALAELLSQGSTERLTQTPPVSRAADVLSPKPRDGDELYPDEESLAATAIGASTRRYRPRTLGRPPVQISVVHGNLAFASYPVAVGHYAGDTIISAEKSLDQALDEALSRRNRLGVYPGAIETNAIFINPKLASNPAVSPPGAIVVGLGTVGNLTASALTRSFTRALLEYAIVWSECGPRPEEDVTVDRPTKLNVSTLLIGTGAGGIPVTDSVFALLKAVRAADRALASAKHSQSIRHLEYIELWEDQAIQAVKALDTILSQEAMRSAFEFDGQLHALRGGLKRVSYEEPGGWWQRLQILGETKDGEHGDGTLRFSAATRRARSEVRLLPTQRALVDQFIQRSIRTTADNRTVARTLFELLLPNEIKDQAPDQDDVVLILDEEAAQYPWELLDDRLNRGERPLFVERGVLRQLESFEFRETVRGVTSRTALVIGDPVSKFTELKGAQDEADAVWRVLQNRGNFQVRKYIRPDSQQIVNALYAADYRVLHLAGHGVYRFVPKESTQCSSCGQALSEELRAKQKKFQGPVTGMIIGDDTVLSPKEVRQMRFVPELVFINCCHLGYIEPGSKIIPEEHNTRNDYNRIAANVATEFIRMGVRAVIAAGWAVVDGAAATFATTFYEQMLNGQSFGNAVKEARRVTYDDYRESNTWGAFQCYGDPDYRLIKKKSKRAGKRDINWVTPSEAAADLNNIAAWLSTMAGQDLEPTLRQVEEKVKWLHDKKWLDNGRVCAALGRAFGEAKQYDKAIEYYEKALRTEDGQVTVKDIEQLANLEARQAARIMADKKHEDLLPVLERTIRRLKFLMELSMPRTDEDKTRLTAEDLEKTSERLSILGSAYKRKAWICVKDRKDSLAQMHDCYDQAFDFGRRKGRFDAYPLLNKLTADLAFSWQAKGKKFTADKIRDAVDLITAAQAELKNTLKAEKNFWNVVMLADAELLKVLYEGRYDVQGIHKISEKYLDARNMGSPREFESVIDQMDFLVVMAGRKKTVVDMFERLKKKLQ